MLANTFFKNGWIKFPYDRVLDDWVQHCLPVAHNIACDQKHQQWLRCGGTWFAGVNVLGNDSAGRITNGPMLTGKAVEFIHQELDYKNICWDSGQLSICYPGYPKPMQGESDSAFGYRLKRDAAHVDGLLPEGEHRRRHLREHHGFILGIPLIDIDPDASPLVVWQGSHEIFRHVFNNEFKHLPCSQWGDIDVTEIYQSTRKEIFETCKRIKVYAKPGEAYLIHRFALHGVAPWKENKMVTDDGRMICYFRPESSCLKQWLSGG